MSAKITRTNGPQVGPVPPQEFDQHQFFKQDDGGDDLSPGSSSSESETSNEKTPDKNTKTDETRKPAPTTGNPFSPGRTGGSSARRTAGGQGKPARR